jgi:hypothetical protein
VAGVPVHDDGAGAKRVGLHEVGESVTSSALVDADVALATAASSWCTATTCKRGVINVETWSECGHDSLEGWSFAA